MTDQANEHGNHRSLLSALLSSVALLVSIILFGCAAQNAYERGQAAMASGDFDSAVLNFKEAAALSPTSSEYQSALENARKNASQQHVATAKEQQIRKELRSAKDSIEKSLTYFPSDAALLQLAKDIDHAIKGAQAKKIIALALVDRGSWDEAISNMKSGLDVDASLPGGRKTLEEIAERAARDCIRKASKELSGDNFDKAVEFAQASLRFRPNNQEAAAVIGEISNKKEALLLFNEAKSDFEERNLGPSITKLDRAAELYPGNSGIAEFAREVKESFCRDAITRGDCLFAEAKFSEAIVCYRESKALLPSHGEVDKLISKAQDEIDLLRIERMLKNGADINRKHEQGGGTELHDARSKAVVEFLIAHGAQLEARNGSGWTPLYLAAALSVRVGGNPEVAASLIRNGAELETANNNGKSPFWVAAQCNPEVLQLLQSYPVCIRSVGPLTGISAREITLMVNNEHKTFSLDESTALLDKNGGRVSIETFREGDLVNVTVPIGGRLAIRVKEGPIVIFGTGGLLYTAELRSGGRIINTKGRRE